MDSMREVIEQDNQQEAHLPAFSKACHTLRAILHSPKLRNSEEQQRVADILNRAIEDIKKSKTQD